MRRSQPWEKTGERSWEQAMRALTRRLPRRLKVNVWRVLDRLGPLPQRIRAGPARGMVLWAPLSRGRAYCAGLHEPHVMAALSRLVLPGMTVCDLGGHLGYYTLALAQLVGGSGHVYTFEPLPRHAALLQRNLERNHLSQVTLVQQAAGDETGTAWLEESRNDAMTRIVQRESPARSHDLAPVRVPITRLDDWAAGADLRRLDLIKLDIEGQELAALQGAENLLARYRPRIVCEIHRNADVPYRPLEIVAWLRERGYDVTLIPLLEHPNASLPDILTRLEAVGLRSPGVMFVAHVLGTPVRA